MSDSRKISYSDLMQKFNFVFWFKNIFNHSFVNLVPFVTPLSIFIKHIHLSLHTVPGYYYPKFKPCLFNFRCMRLKFFFQKCLSFFPLELSSRKLFFTFSFWVFFVKTELFCWFIWEKKNPSRNLSLIGMNRVLLRIIIASKPFRNA